MSRNGFLFFNLISYFSNFLTKKCKKCVFLEKKSQNFGSFFFIIQKNLRLGEKTNKKSVPRAKYSLHDKSNNLDFL